MNFNISSTPSLFFGEGKFKLIETLDVYKKSKGIILITGQRSFIGSKVLSG